METSSFRDRLATLVSDSDIIQSNTNPIQEHSTSHNLQNTAIPSGLQDYERFFNTQPNLGVQTSVYKSCRPICSCVCHRESRIKSPKWTESIIGTLFLGYSGVPTIGVFSAKCTEVACRRNKSAIINVQYRFPPWFFHRMIVMALA